MPENVSLQRRFDLVVFDWDGTLADSTGVIATALQSACRDIGCDVPDDATARYVIGLGMHDAVRHIAPGLDPGRYPQLAHHYRNHYFAAAEAIPLYAHARELLADLRRTGHLLAVATGKSRTGLDRALAFHSLADVFHATRCADEGMPKPHPDMLLHLMTRLGAARERVVMIGDTTHDLEMAARAGVRSMALTHGAHASEALAGASLGMCASLAEVRKRLGLSSMLGP